jgi:tRNA A-37 threonylcarbamoyl transferase component Bud32
MTASTRCPNRACGQVSQLVDDPLGRIFRCPRCLTKLPTAPAAAADSGWTALMRPSLHPRVRSGGARASRAGTRGRATAVAVADPEERSSGFESAELEIGGELGLDDESQYGSGSDPGLHLGQSSAVFVEPFSHPGSLVSAWSSALKTVSGSATSAARSAARSIGSSVMPDSNRGSEFGRFRVLGILGEGQHATVYRAYDAILDRDVALKVPRQGVLKTAKALERFLGEARAQARLRHPRIVPVYEAGCVGARHYLAMALIEGRSLAERLADDGPLAPRPAAEVIAELAEALDYAHAQGVVHRDVKPANVRLDSQGAVYLMDFGIAYRPDSDEVPVPPGTILGTPAYVAPEQARGGQADVLPASDQYSLGAVFYELLCGQPPFSGPPSYVLFHAIHHQPPSPRSVVSGIPRPLAAICLKALAKRPEQRYADCRALAEDLRHWLRGETPLAHRRAWARLGGLVSS